MEESTPFDVITLRRSCPTTSHSMKLIETVEEVVAVAELVAVVEVAVGSRTIRCRRTKIAVIPRRRRIPRRGRRRTTRRINRFWNFWRSVFCTAFNLHVTI